MSTLGIDEAGRGPVIGPLVIAGVIGSDKKLKYLGVKDSKDLSTQQRNSMYNEIIEVVDSYKIIKISPKEIDKAVLGKSNLNWLEADYSIKIINELKPSKVILDCPSNNTVKYKEYVVNRVNAKIKIISEHKADEKYPTVSAASILAKVTRDREIEKIKDKINENIGSGYPSDPVTVEFLKKNWNEYDIFRKSWETYQKVKGNSSQSKLGDFRG